MSKNGSTITISDAEAHTSKDGVSASEWSVLDHSARRSLVRHVTDEDQLLGNLIEYFRPSSLRDFDQIPMRTPDLIRQARNIGPLLADKTVVFIGDDDGTSLVLGLIAMRGGPCPANMLVVDFDLRFLVWIREFATAHGFGHLLSVRPYNVFDPVPEELRGRFDWFYTNPPYGSSNEGLSARVFLSRAMELVNDKPGQGCVILPFDEERRWTQVAWNRTETFFSKHGWEVTEKTDGAHRYHLDDDPDLPSSSVRVHRARVDRVRQLPYQGRRVAMSKIRHFYGRTVKPPFPRYIREDGSYDLDWDMAERQIA